MKYFFIFFGESQEEKVRFEVVLVAELVSKGKKIIFYFRETRRKGKV